MGKNIESFSEYRNRLNESSVEVNPSSAYDFISKAISQAKDVRAARDSQTGGKVSSSFGDFKNMTGLDLLLATKVGRNLEEYFITENPDVEATDSPEPFDVLIDKIKKDSRLSKDLEKNEESIRDLNDDEKSVLKPNAALLPPSRPYSFKNKEKITWDSLKNTLEKANYWKEMDPDRFNLVGLRNYLSVKKNSSNHFVDLLVLMSPEKDKKVWVYEATTVPGPMFMAKPFRNWYVASGSKRSVNPKGLAILQPGVYKYKVGSHRGYKAFVQDGRVDVDRYRPVDKPSQANFNTFSPGNGESGYFGINIHRANSKRESTNVNTWSAGCMVFSKASSLNEVLRKLKSNGQRKIEFALVEMDDFGRYLA